MSQPQPYQVMPPLAEAEYEAMKASIARGYDPARPIVVDENGTVLDGHHRKQVCAELGITPSAVTLPGLTEEQKHDYAMRANLACRHLTQLQKRELIKAELQRNPGRSDREIGRLCGADHKTVGAVRRGEIPHPDRDDAYLAARSEALEMLASLGLGADDAAAASLAEWFLVEESARGLLRYGVLDPPPAAWKPVPPGNSRNRLIRKSNRLTEWRTRVEMAAGEFLNWCDAAGITIGKRGISFPGQLAYPLDDEVRQLLGNDGWTPLDEDLAARGHFYAWWYTRDELREMCGDQLDHEVAG